MICIIFVQRKLENPIAYIFMTPDTHERLPLPILSC